MGPKDFTNNEVRAVQRFDNKKYQLKLEDIEVKTKEALENI